jgi:hypothetical protein
MISLGQDKEANVMSGQGNREWLKGNSAPAKGVQPFVARPEPVARANHERFHRQLLLEHNVSSSTGPGRTVRGRPRTDTVPVYQESLTEGQGGIHK